MHHSYHLGRDVDIYITLECYNSGLSVPWQCDIFPFHEIYKLSFSFIHFYTKIILY